MHSRTGDRRNAAVRPVTGRSAAVALALLACPGVAFAASPACTGKTGPDSGHHSVSSESVQSPGVGEERTVELGETLIFQSKLGLYATAVTVKEPLTFTGRAIITNSPRHEFKVTAPAGRYEVVDTATGIPGSDPKNMGYAGTFDLPSSAITRLKDGAPYPNARIQLVLGTPGARLQWNIGSGFWMTDFMPAKLDFEYCSGESDDNFRKELIYSGVSQGVVSLTYREFVLNERKIGDQSYSTWLARPSFTQDLKYDLAEGRQIGFRGGRFEVLKATNTDITYRVIKPLD